MKTSILSFLLHHANREGKNKSFYKIKNKILSKYGKHICYDVQYIEGKRCFSCGGTGIYVGYNHKSECYNCGGTGWFKLPEWNILARLQFGKYTFHQPWKRSYIDPKIQSNKIEGYIEHNRSKYGRFSLALLFLIYDRKGLKRMYDYIGLGWRCYWYLPKNYLNNIIWLFRKKHFINLFKPTNRIYKCGERIYYEYTDNNELPF
jgi:hypothetical protein